MKNQLLLYFCILIFMTACNTNRYYQQSAQRSTYIEQERQVGKHVYDFYWALSQDKLVQAGLYTNDKGWKAVTKISKEAIRDYKIQGIELFGNNAEVTVLVNHKHLTKLFLVNLRSEWIINEAALIGVNQQTNSRNERNVRNNRKKRGAKEPTNRNREEVINRAETKHLAKQKVINQQVAAFYKALNRKDISSAAKLSTSNGLHSVMNLPFDFVNQYKIENIFLYGDIADVEVLINGEVHTLTVLIKEGDRWLINELEEY